MSQRALDADADEDVGFDAEGDEVVREPVDCTSSSR